MVDGEEIQMNGDRLQAHGGPLLAGVDVGTTTIKAVIYNLQGQAVAQSRVRTRTYYPQPSWAYYEPEELWQQVATVLREAVAQIADSHRIVSVAIASMAEAAVPLDDQNRPTYHAIAWFDQRPQAQAQWLNQTIGRDRIFEITGLPLQPIFGLCKLLWLKETHPEAYARTARWLNLADYIAFRLCGVAATDYSLGTRTMAMNLHDLKWSEELLGQAGISVSIFPPLAPSGTLLGHVTADGARDTGLSSATQVSAGGHDHICGALAVGVTQPGILLNSLGTAEAVFLPLDRPLTDPQVGRQSYAQGAHVVPDHYYILGGLHTSGASIEWMREILGKDIEYQTLIAEAAEVPPGSLGTFFLPYLRMGNPPHEDPWARGAFIGLNTDVKRGALFRAVLEGLAMGSRDTMEPLFQYSGVAPLQTIYAVGGGTRNELLMQIKAAVLNKQITIPAVEEATALGAALLGGLGAGIYPTVSAALAGLQYTQRVIEPDPTLVDLYETCFRQVFQKIHPTLRSLHHTIHDL
ncbi:MAG: carbohydrate kinase [Chloroflexi bacterium]|nr:carbohydrate kinase [Chloroflexota bacterium]